MEAKLIVVGGDAKATEITLKLPTIIGRGRGASLTLPHPLVSRRHCEIFERDGQLYVRDLGSLNGTFIGNEPVDEAPLPPGELLTIGAVTFRALYGEALEEARQSRERELPTSKPKSSSHGPVETVANSPERTKKSPHTAAPRRPDQSAPEEKRGVHDRPTDRPPGGKNGSEPVDLKQVDLIGVEEFIEEVEVVSDLEDGDADRVHVLSEPTSGADEAPTDCPPSTPRELANGDQELGRTSKPSHASAATHSPAANGGAESDDASGEPRPDDEQLQAFLKSLK